ncbi:MAG: 23S rRNA (uracil(1939)-C(5))-methyltransferase RlmD [Planctomycetota bacterium]
MTAERLAFGGACVGRHEGLAVFVPFAAPGDRVIARIETVEQNRATARLERVLEPSSHRREARCRHFGDCGGCHFQHVDYEAQLEAKRTFVEDALARIGGIEDAGEIPIESAAEWRYRSRTQLKVKGRHLGFNRAFSHDVVDVVECPVMAEDLEAHLAALRETIAALPRADLPYQVDGACGLEGASFAPDMPGVRKDLVTHEVLGFRYLIEPESFFQGNRHLVARLVEGAVGGEGGGTAYDLYAGVGLFTLPLSTRFERVEAVEDERRAATLGRVNAKLNGRDNVAYFRRTTEQFLAGGRPTPDLVLMDPPRLGAKPVIPALVALHAPRIVYVSCDPNTLARDLARLREGGYRIESVAAFDMFPQTYHVECVAKLALR